MTINDLRKFYPHHEFYFYENGKGLVKAPFIHTKIKGFKIYNDNMIFIDL
jgi:hypothetical protein